MRQVLALLVALLAVGCGASSTAPTPTPTLPSATVDCTLVGTLPCQIPPPTTPTPTPTFTVSGTVTDATSHGALQNVTVTLGSGSATTDSTGHYAIANLPKGTLTLEASAAGYVTYSAVITVAGSITQDIALSRLATPTPDPPVMTGITAPPGLLVGDTVPILVSTLGNWICPCSFAWTFGDGATETTATTQTSHVYLAAGTYTVTVTANGATRATTVTISPLQLAATVSCTPGTHSSGGGTSVATVCNIATMTYGRTPIPLTAITAVAWEWGDGTTSATIVGSNTYVNAGTYVVTATVTATTADGPKSATATKSIVVP